MYKKTFLIMVAIISLFLLIGCTTKKFDKECINPEFLGSEGITANEDLDRAFEQSEPILGATHRYYDKQDGNALWICNPDIEVLFDCGDYMIRGTQKKDELKYHVNNPQRLNKTKTNWYSIGYEAIGLDNQICSPMKVEPYCAYLSGSDCRNSRNGYLRVYRWQDGWAKSCELRGTIFTMSSTGKGYANNTRCAVEDIECKEWGCIIMSDDYEMTDEDMKHCGGYKIKKYNAVCNDRMNCIDSDGGINYYVKGTRKYNLYFEEKFHYESSDRCSSGTTLIERYCDDDGHAQNTPYECPNGCKDGACI